ncbi:MAG: TraR/DksA family transcriptional regulator [Alphaproteobacteria bacterium]|nr:MAG: TraR/DksA family transcriptional regulator [Alphaproteobacteria bacterium]
MEEAFLARCRAALEAELAALESLQAGTEEARRPVTLDQPAVGRLSRMDALQLQAMARASDRLREQRKARIRAALSRMDAGEYGYCVKCGDEIAAKRLEADPTVPLCIGCASGRG